MSAARARFDACPWSARAGGADERPWPRRSGQTTVCPAATSRGATARQVVCVRGCPCSSTTGGPSPRRGPVAAHQRRRRSSAAQSPRTSAHPGRPDWPSRWPKVYRDMLGRRAQDADVERCDGDGDVGNGATVGSATGTSGCTRRPRPAPRSSAGGAQPGRPPCGPLRRAGSGRAMDADWHELGIGYSLLSWHGDDSVFGVCGVRLMTLHDRPNAQPAVPPEAVGMGPRRRYRGGQRRRRSCAPPPPHPARGRPGPPRQPRQRPRRPGRRPQEHPELDTQGEDGLEDLYAIDPV